MSKLSILTYIPKLTAILTLVVACIVMFGWYADIEVLKGVVLGFPTTKFNTALCFVLSSVVLFGGGQGFSNTLAEYARKSCAYIVLGVAVVTLLEYVLNINLFIDAEFTQLMIYFSPLVLVAYITTLLISDMHSSKKMFKALAETDPLTGLLNKRSFMPLFEHALSQALTLKQSLSIMIVEIDNLKGINSQYGYQVGDKVILSLSKIIRESCRSQDINSHFGGDAFMIAIPQLSSDKVIAFGERLSKAITNTSFVSGESKITFTVSIGIATYPSQVEEINELMSKADESLFAGKNMGGNTVVHYGESITLS